MLRPVGRRRFFRLRHRGRFDATLFLVLSAGVAAQLATSRLRAWSVLALGTISLLTGLALRVTAVRLSTPSLALFLIAGAVIGGGAGAVFKGTTVSCSPPRRPRIPSR
jgi:hypothetical protein